MLKVISRSTFDLQTVLDTLVESVTGLCDAYNSLIFLRDDKHLHVKAHYGPLLLDFDEWPIKPTWITGRAFLDRAPVHVDDAQAVVQEFPEGGEMAIRLGYRTILSVPLLRESVAIGAITIRRSEVKRFTDRQVELVRTFADQAVIAIENTRLLNELRQRTGDLTESLEQQTATSKVLEVISRSAFDLNAIFETVAESSVRLCSADRAFIFRFDGELLRMVVAFNATPEFKDWVESHPFGPDVTAVPPVRRSNDEPSTFQMYWLIRSIPTGQKMSSQSGQLLGVPILKGEELLGVMMIYHLEVRPFTDKQIALVDTFADQAAIAIENTRLLAELRKSLDRQTATSEVLRVISSSPTQLEPVFNAILENATRICEAISAISFFGKATVSGSCGTRSPDDVRGLVSTRACDERLTSEHAARSRCLVEGNAARPGPQE